MKPSTVRYTAVALSCAIVVGTASCSSSHPAKTSATSTTVAAASKYPSVAGGSGPAGSSNASSVAIVNAAADKTFANKTANVVIEIKVANGPDATITGPFNLADGQGQLSLTMSGSNLAGAIPNPSTLLYANGNLYLKATGIVTSFDAGKPWAQITPSTMQQIFGLLMPGTSSGPVAQLASGNPGNLLNVLDTPDMTVTPAPSTGPDSLPAPAGAPTASPSAGPPVTYYTVTINPAAAVKAATGEAQQLFQLMAASGTSAPITVGIDTNGVLHSLTASFTASGTQVQLDLTLTAFGTPVNVSAPAPADTAPLTLPAGNLPAGGPPAAATK